MLRLKSQCQADNKFGAFALFCLNFNRSSHHIHNVLSNGHTKACPLSPADGGSPLPFKRRKNLLYKFRTHADSTVFYTDLIQTTVFCFSRELFQPNGNGSTGRRKFDRIGQKIQQYLIQTRLIAIDVLIRHIHSIHIKLQLLRMDLPTDNGFQIMEHF